MDARIAVIGLGTIGSMVLWQLAEQGETSVIGLDKSHIADDRTALGGESRLYRLAYKEGAEYGDLLQNSRDLWMQLENESCVPVFIPCGALTIGDADKDYMGSLLTSVASTGVEHEVLQPDQLRERFPQHRVYDSDIGLYDPAGGVIRTNTAVLTAVEKAQSLGATVHTNTQVLDIVPEGDGVRVITSDSSYLVEKVVIAAGAWARELLPRQYATQVHPERVILTWATARNPQLFAPDKFPVFIRDTDGTHMFGVPAIDGDMVKVSGVIADHEVSEMSCLDRNLSEDEKSRTLAAIERFFPDLFPSIVRGDAYADLFSTDMKPLLGPVPGQEKIFLATAFSGRGFKMATGVGAAVAKSLREGTMAPEISFASPDRFDGAANVV